MIRFQWKETVETFVCVMGVTGVLAMNAVAQYGGGGTGAGGGAAASNFQNNYHVGFDRPEAGGSNTSHRARC